MDLNERYFVNEDLLADAVFYSVFDREQVKKQDFYGEGKHLYKEVGMFSCKQDADEYAYYLNYVRGKSFTLTKKMLEWIKEHSKHCISHGTAGEQFKFEFFPTGLVDFQKVTCIICGEKFEDEE